MLEDQDIRLKFNEKEGLNQGMCLSYVQHTHKQTSNSNSQDLSYECTPKKFSYFSTKTYVVGTEKNGLIETVLLITQKIC